MSQPPLPYQSVPYADPNYTPKVVTWFKVYAVGMALLYVLVFAAGVFFIASPEVMASSPTEAEGIRVQGIAMLVVGIPLAAGFGAAPFLPRRTWVWVYDLVLIAIGLTSCCLWPATIPLLIFWIKPEVRGWFSAATV